MVFDAKLKSSNHNEFIEEYENFTSSILNNVNINQFDISFLSNYILPQLQKGLCEKNYYKRFSSGTFLLIIF